MTATLSKWHTLRVLDIGPGEVMSHPADLIGDAWAQQADVVILSASRLDPAYFLLRPAKRPTG